MSLTAAVTAGILTQSQADDIADCVTEMAGAVLLVNAGDWTDEQEAAMLRYLCWLGSEGERMQ